MDFENLNIILKKTEKGLTALKIRDQALPQKLRVLLILVDGKKTMGEIAPLLTVGSDTHAKFKELFDLGFAEEVSPSLVTASEVGPKLVIAENIQTAAVSSNISLNTAIRTATRMLTEMLGPNSDLLCIQLEKCKTKDEFNAKILEYRKVVGTMRTEKLGDEFVKAAIF